MKVTGAALILLLFSFLDSYAQLYPGAKQISLSHSDIASVNDVFSLYNNPAGLGRISWREVGIYYSPAPFGFKELSNSSIAYSEPVLFGSTAIGAMTYGFKLYRETKILAAIACKFQSVYTGLAISYHNVSIEKYGKDQAIYLDLGAQIDITKDIKWGGCLHNINRATFGKSEGQIPVVFNSGFSFDPLSNLTLNIGFEKDLNFNPSLLMGIDYNILECIAIRSGFATEPDKYSAGVGIFYSLFNLDYAFFSHPVLGLTHQATIIIRFRESTLKR